ncbi:hypothetical protein [Streptomyces antibioticus]|uniref:hypothetical protein n=1 Tax=Streptomyces antibioticus TaxID=1890 RepID=UPI0033A434BC
MSASTRASTLAVTSVSTRASTLAHTSARTAAVAGVVVVTAWETRAAQVPQCSRCFSRDQAADSGRVPSA